jgi:hypothetical protein
MSIYSIKYQSNKDLSDVATLKLYLVSATIFLTVALIPTIIFS